MKKSFLVVDDQLGWRNFNSAAIINIFGDDIILDNASSAQEGYSKVLECVKSPYDIIITDMQMETDYAPLMAGEWFIEQIQNLKSYYKTKIVIISAAPNIKQIADSYNVFYIPKRIAAMSLDAYKEIFAYDIKDPLV